MEPEGRSQRSTLPPSRPAVVLPSRSSMDSLVSPVDISPGLSDLLTEDPELSFSSFSLLLAGDIGPTEAAPSPPRRAEDKDQTRIAKRELGRGGGNEVSLSLGRRRSANLEVNQNMPLITFTAGIRPSSLFQSPLSIYTSNQGQYGVSNQQNESQATAQAAQLQSHPFIRTSEYPPSTISSAAAPAAATTTTFNLYSLNQQTSYNIPPLSVYGLTWQPASVPLAEKKRQATNQLIVVNKPADDGYNWRKYGQKQVKGGEYPRSYYKCTQSKCLVKKKVERSFDGQITEIIYKGQHNHQPPQQKYREAGGEHSDFAANFSIASSAGTHKRGPEYNHGSVHLSESDSDCSDDEQEDETSMDENDDSDVRRMKRKRKGRNMQTATASSKTVTEAKVILQTTSEVEVLDDGYRWRKYGKKVVKGNPHPRSYYKCTNSGCSVRKHVERASSDYRAVITTYEGKHNHHVPAPTN